jgi:gamma-glutamyltranspeptidase/glutathione hydrolase
MPHETYATKFGLRPIVYGCRGMVATANPLATLAGVRMLAEGGNAVDAIVAAAAAIGVAEPYMSGLAGCGACVLTPPDNTPRVLVFLGRAPNSATPDRFPGGHPDAGYQTPAVPGNLAGWARIHGEYGKLSLAHALKPAIELAERGVPFTSFDHQIFSEDGGRLAPEGVATYLHRGRIPEVGSLLVQPDLARTFRRIAAEGIGYLYGGELGLAIDRLMRERGGLLTLADLRAYPETLRWTTPIQVTYRGVTVYAPPPPTSAIQALETLNVLNGFDIGRTGHLSPDHIAIVAEASRAARLDTDRYVGDPAFATVPVDHLLSPRHTRELVAEAECRLRAPSAEAGAAGGGAPAREGGTASTTHLAAVDASGLAVNITESVGHGFGSGVVVPSTGVCLNNAIHWFSMTPGHPNLIAPGKTHEFPIAPLHLHRDGRFLGTIGTPGSYGILVTTVQVLVHLLDFGLNLQDAIAAPRFRWIDDVGDQLPARVMWMESRVPETTRGALATRGYEIELLGPWSMRVGGVQGTLVNYETGWIAGGADPRRNGYAIGW